MKIDYLITIFQESLPQDLELLAKVITAVKAQTVPVNIVVIYDLETPHELQQFVAEKMDETKFTTWQRFPISKKQTQYACMLGIQEYYNQCSADYVVINHSDDIPERHRVEIQLRSLEKHPECAISLAGFVFMDGNRASNQTFQLTEKGLNYGIPSGWMLNRRVLKRMEYTPTIPMRDDVVYLLEVLHEFPMISVKIPLFTYEYRRTREQYNEQENAISWRQYQVYWTTHKDGLKHLISYYDAKKIMMVGFFADWYETGLIADELAKMNLQIIRIAADQIRKDKFTMNKVEGHLLDDIGDDRIRLFAEKHALLIPLKPYVEKYKPDLIMIQQMDLALDMEDLKVPWIYYVSEIVWKRWIYSSKGIQYTIPKGLFYAYHGAPAYYQNIHSYQMNQIPRLRREFISYAWDPRQYPPKSEREKHEPQHFIGWMGNTGDENETNPDADFMECHMRNMRSHYVTYAQRHAGMHIAETRSVEEYGNYMRSCELALNVPGMAGWVNQRQFHAAGIGCCLLQYRYNGISHWGLKDMENCLMFGGNELYHGYGEGEQELLHKIQWATNHPTELRAIQAKGQQWAKNHTYAKKAEQIWEAIQRWE